MPTLESYTPGMLLDRLLPSEVDTLNQRIARAFTDHGAALYLVGGVVRDALLGAPDVSDLDYATSAAPTLTRQALQAAGADAIYAVGEKFGTIGAVFGTVRVEVTTYRAEQYSEGSRHPEVSFHGTLEDDLSRRDFTINAIALDPASGGLVDPHGGLNDLRTGLVRAVGKAQERFREDPLRLLRAVRFTVRLGFDLAEETAAAVRAEAPSLARISRERVRDELNKLLTGPEPSRGVLLLCDLKLAEHSLPELLAMRGMQQEAGRYKDVFAHTLQVLDRTPPRLGLRWAALLHDVAKPRTLRVQPNGEVHFFGHDRVGERMARKIMLELRQDTHLAEAVAHLVGLHLRANAYEPDWTDGAVRRFVREVGDDALEDLLALSRADVTSARADRRMAIARSVAELEARIRTLREQEDIAKLASPLDGHDLMTLFDRKPGPWIKPIKDHLLELVLDGVLAQDDREAATEIALRLYEELELTGR